MVNKGVARGREGATESILLGKHNFKDAATMRREMKIHRMFYCVLSTMVPLCSFSKRFLT